MADAEDLLEQTRQKLVQIVRLMMRYMDNRSRGDSRFFRDLVERQAPGMPAMIDQGRGIPETSAQIDQFLQPGWDDRLTQAFGVIRDDHPVFQDPAVQQANNEYLALRSQAAAQRAPQINGASVAITETSAFGRPGATRTFRDLTGTPAAATTPTAPPSPAQVPRPAAAPGPAQTSRPAAPGPAQPTRPAVAPGAGQAARPAGPAPAVQSPAARAGQQAGPVGPGGQATPPTTRAPGA
ncbi:MAG TPA: hypothetical protein VG497_33850, partial [Kribbella sp.]|nr:hypothetical protein [Kribbella sp.]